MYIIVHPNHRAEIDVPPGAKVIRFREGSKFPFDFTEGVITLEELVA